MKLAYWAREMRTLIVISIKYDLLSHSWTHTHTLVGCCLYTNPEFNSFPYNLLPMHREKLARKKHTRITHISTPESSPGRSSIITFPSKYIIIFSSSIRYIYLFPFLLFATLKPINPSVYMPVLYSLHNSHFKAQSSLQQLFTLMLCVCAHDDCHLQIHSPC